MGDNFKHNLLWVKEELAPYHRKKEELSLMYLQTRLDQSLKSYYAELKNSYQYLERRGTLKTIQKLRKDE